LKTLTEVSDDKVRGGFYSSPALVQACFDRVAHLSGTSGPVRLLEPSAGDGAFIRGLRQTSLPLDVSFVTAIEVLPAEAAKCAAELEKLNVPGRSIGASFLDWAADANDEFDVAVGNPPFVRYQFINQEDGLAITKLGDRLGISFAGVSNLWIPVLLGSLARLRIGGVFAFIVPTECLTGISAGIVREWLTRHVASLQIDLFPAGSFPGVLQEVLILSGIRQGSVRVRNLRIVDHDPSDGASKWDHPLSEGKQNWTRYLLTPSHLTALSAAITAPLIKPLGSIARFEVAAVTGANEYFSVNLETLKKYRLTRWAEPLLPRLRHAAGLRYTGDDHQKIIAAGASAFLLHFRSDLPDPLTQPLPRTYLQGAYALGIPERYKCRIRNPWFRVPHVRSGELLLSKRAHFFHRMVVNEADAVTTDTIYRGRILDKQLTTSDLVAAFHNSLTLLTSELEGRNFGGGVLELVPSEIARLRVPAIAGFGTRLDRLDHIARTSGDPDRTNLLVNSTNRALADAGAIPLSVLRTLEEARHRLLSRRLARAGLIPTLGEAIAN
jgi:adenine-specific DNA-methyltransferase